MSSSCPTKNHSTTDSLAAAASADVWKRLVASVEQEGGYVHPDIDLKVLPNNNGGDRGLFATRAIAKGQDLIRIPSSMVISGQDLPKQYDKAANGVDNDNPHTTTTIHVSTWLQCLARFWQVTTTTNTANNNSHQTYLDSLPTSYETLWQWSDTEMDIYLAGAHPPLSSSSANQQQNPWNIRNGIQERYQTQIRPYLVHCGILSQTVGNNTKTTNEELEQFAMAGQVLSTRGFHTATDTEEQQQQQQQHSDSSDSYAGPFLIPVMDLINHASSSTQTCTTLQRTTPTMFGMQAERDIEKQQEILHSYGDERTRAQFLASFGFVPGLEQATLPQQHGSDVPPSSPVVLSKTQVVWKACWHVLEESDIPQQIEDSMKDMDDETWTLHVDRTRTADYVPDDIVIVSFKENGKQQEEDMLLTDELVTAACVPFLPKCAYSEITSRTLLDKSILEDYFLGKLVCMALLKAIEIKRNEYTPIPSHVIPEACRVNASSATTTNNPTDKECGNKNQDRELLGRLLKCPNLSVSARRLAYGLTVRIEEQNTLDALARQVLTLLHHLDDDDDDAGDDISNSDSATKKQRTIPMS